jgi:hypothetical protein
MCEIQGPVVSRPSEAESYVAMVAEELISRSDLRYPLSCCKPLGFPFKYVWQSGALVATSF